MNKKLSNKIFVFFSILTLASGLFFIGALYFVINIQYQTPTNYSKLGPVTTLPKSLRIDLERPDENSLTFDQSIIVSGKTGPNLDVLIATNTQSFVIRSKQDGNFSMIIDLNEGINKITAAVFDATGDSRFEQRTVYYSKEKL